MVLGLSPNLEGEEMEVKVEGFRGGDSGRTSECEAQEELLRAVHATGKPVVLFLLSGSALAVNWAQDNVAAIVHAWYPTARKAARHRRCVFGDYNPAGACPSLLQTADQLRPLTITRGGQNLPLL